MRTMKTTDAIAALNVLALAAVLAVLVAGRTPAAIAQSGPVDLASQQRAELIEELAALNASVSEANAMTRKQDERQQRHREAQIELLRELAAAVARHADAQSGLMTTQHDEMLTEIDDLGAAVEESVAELQRLSDEANARHEEQKVSAVARDAALRKFLEDGSVTVTIGDPKAKKKRATPKKNG
jgi:hypothetical protein